jgi:hypothetical protein
MDWLRRTALTRILPSSDPQCIERAKQSAREAQHPHVVSAFYPPPCLADCETGWSVDVFSVSHNDVRWRKQRIAADQSYIRRGLETVGRDHRLASLTFPTYASEVVCKGNPIGGGCIHLQNRQGRLPLEDELIGFVEPHRLSELIRDCSVEGIVHCAGLWIDPRQTGTGLAGDIARAYLPMVFAARARFYLATSHQHILDAWCSLGWQPVKEFETFPYPDDRYQTCLILGDVTRLPSDLKEWAEMQVNGVHLDEGAANFTIAPMRAT